MFKKALFYLFFLQIPLGVFALTPSEKSCVDSIKRQYSLDTIKDECSSEKIVNINFYDDEFNAPLHYASSSGRIKVIQYLVEQGALIDLANHSGLTALHIAAVKNYSNTVKFLLKKGAFIDFKDREGDTPLMLASNYGNYSVVRLLVKEGADLNIKNDMHQNAFLESVASGDLKTMQYLALTKNTHTHTHNWIKGEDALQVACKDEVNLKSIDFLIEQGFKINKRALFNGETALFYSVRYGNLKLAEYLLAHNADINKRNFHKRTPLDVAIMIKNYKMVNFLLKHGAKLDNPSVYGQTARDIAKNLGIEDKIVVK